MKPPTATTRTVSNPRGIVRLTALAALTVACVVLTGAQAASAASGVVEPTVLPAGAPNGTPASPTAVLALNSPGRLTRTYAHSALVLTSRLLDVSGAPISGARIDIVQHVAGGAQAQAVGYAITRPDGTFTAHVPPGPSRTIDLAYQAYEGTPVYAAQTEIIETVTAGLRLRITPWHVGPNATIHFDGRVLGTVPREPTALGALVTRTATPKDHREDGDHSADPPVNTSFPQPFPRPSVPATEAGKA